MDDLDADLDSLLTEADGRNSRQCTVGFLLDQVTEDQRSKLETLIDGGSVPASRVAFVLQKNGYRINYASIARHRRRKKGQSGCTCP